MTLCQTEVTSAQPRGKRAWPGADWDDIAQTHAKLDELGCGGIPGEGEEIAKIARKLPKIAEI
jgi:hypothetical protein